MNYLNVIQRQLRCELVKTCSVVQLQDFDTFSIPLLGSTPHQPAAMKQAKRQLETSTWKTYLLASWYFNETDMVEGQPRPPSRPFWQLSHTCTLWFYGNDVFLILFDFFIFKPTEAWRAIFSQLNNSEFKPRGSLFSACPLLFCRLFSSRFLL